MRPTLILAAGALLAAGSLHAQSPGAQLQALEAAARGADPAFGGFSAPRGAAFFSARHGGDWRCSTCHTDDPRAAGRHAVTGKAIEPLAPSANPARFTDAARTDKWFRRNCKDVLKRECSAQEKGDVVAYLVSLGR